MGEDHLTRPARLMASTPRHERKPNGPTWFTLVRETAVKRTGWIERNDMLTADDIELLKKTAKRIKGYGTMMGSPWQNAEMEVMIVQTIGASIVNLKAHGKPFSFNTIGADGCNGLVRNSEAFQKLKDNGLVKTGKFDKRPTIIVTRKLLNEVSVFLDDQDYRRKHQKRKE